MTPTKPLHSVRKFYFLDYFYILLRSVEKHSQRSEIFNTFKVMKQKHRLGESKYKRLTEDGEVLTQKQQQRYNYTFEQVVEESREYKLILQDNDGSLRLTDKGRDLLRVNDEQNFECFVRALAKLMEDQYEAFRVLVEFLYRANPKRSGVLIFPHYSPLELGFRRKDIQTTENILDYANKLVRKLEGDIQKHLSQTLQLSEHNNVIVNRLKKDGLLPENPRGRFQPGNYNKIAKRIRDFWIMHFLLNLYEWPLTMSTFELWAYRAKQAGVIHVTDFYPFTNGKLVYPTAVVLDRVNSDDFRSIYDYADNKHLYVHEPDSESFRDDFVNEMVKSYFGLRLSSRSYFINLADLREALCYALKISSQTFERILNDIYRLNLQGALRIKISLEVDKLPEETNAMYLKQEPVMVDGSYRNIIAIDVTKGETSK